MNQKNKLPTDLSLHKLRDMFTHKDKSSEPARVAGTTKVQEHSGTIWVDIQDPSPTDISRFTEDYKLHAVQIAQSLQKGQIAQMTVEEDYIFLLLHFPYVHTGSNRVSTSQLSVFLGKDYLVTIHESAAPTVRNLFDAYENSSDPETKSAGHLLFRIIENLLKDTTKLIQSISIELDKIEANVFDDRSSDAFQIGQIRQKIMRLRRTLASQKNVLDDLDAAIDTFTGERLKRYYEANTNASRKLWETVEEARETIEIYKDADFTTSTEHTNEILAVLTLLFTLTIPATVFGTFYGMNILLPGGIEAGSWTFLGDYTVFKIVVFLSFMLALLMYLYFKRKKWF